MLFVGAVAVNGLAQGATDDVPKITCSTLSLLIRK